MKLKLKKDTSGGGKLWQLMSLSLFLMLLAFFIILVSMTETDVKKFSEVQDSIKEQFAPDVMQSLASLSDSETTEFQSKSGHAFDEIEALMKAQIGLISVTRSADGRLMTISMPKRKIYQVPLTFNRGTRNLASQISNIVTRAGNNGVRLSADLVARINAETYNDEALKEDSLGLGRFARALIASNTPKNAVVIGTLPGKETMVTFFFHSIPKSQKDYVSLDGFSYSRFKEREAN